MIDVIYQLYTTKRPGTLLTVIEKTIEQMPDIACDFNRFSRPRIGHRALPQYGAPPESKVYIGLFRDPRLRLKSAYNSHLHAVGIRSSERAQMMAEVKTPQDFVRYPGVAHCQTKMLVGHKCGSSVPVTTEMLEEALNRLRTKFVFVGITDEWRESVFLFNRMFKGENNSNALYNKQSPSHPKRKTFAKNKKQHATSFDFLPEDDPYDWRVYLEAKRIFQENLAKFGIHCKSQLESEAGAGKSTTISDPVDTA